MTEPHSYGVARDASERAALGVILGQSFAFPVEDSGGLMERARHENVRVLREGGQVLGGLFLIPMGQYFGGRSVGHCGLAAVAVAPEARGRGVGGRLLRAALAELRAQGTPLSGLYPATQPLYRAVGYGQAGGHFSVRVPTHALPGDAHGLPLRRTTTGDWPALHALYARVARTRPGWLDRGPYLWSRVDRPRAGPAQGYVVGEEGALEGYAFVLRVRRPEGDRHELRLTDFVTTTERAARRLLAFFADHRSLADDVVWNGLPQEPVLSLLREQSWAVRLEETWMLRLVDVPAALQARGWPRAARGELHLEVEDALFPENAGRWVLSVEEGRARVRPGGAGHLKLDVSALASLYTGFRSVEALAQVGRVEATPEAHELCTVLFAGALPTLPEMF